MSKREKKRTQPGSEPRASAQVDRPRRRGRIRLPGEAPWWAWIPTAVILVWYAVLYVRQAVYRVPVPNRVLGGETVDADRLMVGWAPDHVSGRQLEVQVSRHRDFRDLAFSAQAPSEEQRVFVRPSLEPGVYYWRMRSIIDGKASPWTRRIRFTAED